MTIEELIKIADKFPSVTYDIKWEHHLCFNIADKMFLITSPDDNPVSASFKVAEEDFADMTSKPGCAAAAYMGRYFWVSVDDINRFDQKVWEKILKDSYDLISSKLSKKKQIELGIQ